MIQRHIARTRDYGRPDATHHDQGTFEHTPACALRTLVMAELQYGARIEHVSPTEIRLVTMFVGDRDETEFTGSAEEMRPLVEAVRYYAEHCRNSGRLVICEELIGMLDRLPHGTAADPGFQHLIMPFVRVENLQHCLLAPLGMSPEDIALGASMSLEDLDAALTLAGDTPGMTFRQVVEATAVTQAS